MPKPPQQLPAQLGGNQDCQLKPQLPAEPQGGQGGQGGQAVVGGEAERSLAWRIPLLRFIIEARTVLNVATTDARVGGTKKSIAGGKIFYPYSKLSELSKT